MLTQQPREVVLLTLVVYLGILPLAADSLPNLFFLGVTSSDAYMYMGQTDLFYKNQEKVY